MEEKAFGLQLFGAEGEGAAVAQPMDAPSAAPVAAGGGTAHEETVSAPETGDLEVFAAHFLGLEQQAEAMREVFPDFDLRAALHDPAFARMTAPDVGIRVEDAWYALHRDEIQSAAMQVAAQKTAQKISNDIQAGNRRPSENGTTGQAPSVTTFDYRSASPEQRAALKARIRSGEKIYPGQV